LPVHVSMHAGLVPAANLRPHARREPPGTHKPPRPIQQRSTTFVLTCVSVVGLRPGSSRMSRRAWANSADRFISSHRQPRPMSASAASTCTSVCNGSSKAVAVDGRHGQLSRCCRYDMLPCCLFRKHNVGSHQLPHQTPPKHPPSMCWQLGQPHLACWHHCRHSLSAASGCLHAWTHSCVSASSHLPTQQAKSQPCATLCNAVEGRTGCPAAIPSDAARPQSRNQTTHHRRIQR
jgi:hypothetical protein